jgi:hypothetical protein
LSIKTVINLRKPHPRQLEFLRSTAKRRVIRAGRRGGKTVGMAIFAVEAFLAGSRVLYAAPTQDQVGTFWFEIVEALREPIEAGVFVKNETNHTIELPHTKQRIRAKTAWNADTLRGDYADVLILDEFQLMGEDTWDTVGAPMLLDNDGTAIFIYTPPSLRTTSRSKARDPRYASKMFKRAQGSTDGRWQAFHFTSLENPYISASAIEEMRADMTATAFAQEIMAEDRDDAPGALWRREVIDGSRFKVVPDDAGIIRTVIAVDPSATSGGDECGIVAGSYGEAYQHFYVEGDYSVQASPAGWAKVAVNAYHKHEANLIVYEANQGGEMVAQTLRLYAPDIMLMPVWASKNKQARAEPISLLYEQGKVHHIGDYYKLEDELCMWEPGAPSPNRMDALVWLLTYLKDNTRPKARRIEGR